SARANLPPPSPSVPTKSVSQNVHWALARSSSRPDQRLQPAKRRKTARLPDCTPSPWRVRKHSLTAYPLPLAGEGRLAEGERGEADEDVARAARFGEPQREAKENRVARRHVGDGYPLPDALLGDGDIAGQRRPAECAEIERHDDMPLGKPGGDGPRRLELDPM